MLCLDKMESGFSMDGVVTLQLGCIIEKGSPLWEKAPEMARGFRLKPHGSGVSRKSPMV